MTSTEPRPGSLPTAGAAERDTPCATGPTPEGASDWKSARTTGAQDSRALDQRVEAATGPEVGATKRSLSEVRVDASGDPRIKRSRLADQAYEVLKERILTSQYGPGQRLSVPALAAELGLSRSPVREAVQRIVQDGLGTEQPHHGAVVARADLPALVDLYEVRAVLEGLSTRRATTSGDPDLVTDLESAHSRHQAAFEQGATAGIIRADVAFHERILKAAANPELDRVLHPALQRMTMGMLAADRHWPARALAEHQAVLDAVRAGDPDAASARMCDHINRVRDGLLTKLNHPDEENP